MSRPNQENPRRAELYQEAIDTFGVEEQAFQTEEELAELLVEMKRYSTGDADDEDVIDELADVYIMIQQMAQIHGVDEFDDRVEYKLKRLSKRLRDSQAAATGESDQ